jgi:hypothetical protein
MMSLTCRVQQVYCSSPRWYMSMENHKRYDIHSRKQENSRDKPVPVPLCLSQIPHGLTLAFAVRLVANHLGHSMAFMLLKSWTHGMAYSSYFTPLVWQKNTDLRVQNYHSGAAAFTVVHCRTGARHLSSAQDESTLPCHISCFIVH